MKNEITHIFFDLDHTLWDFDTNSALAFDKIFRKDYPAVITEQFLEKYIPINQACWALFQVDKISHDELRYQRLKQSFDAIQYAVSDHQIEQIANEYIAILPEFNHLFDDALETLNYLKKRYKLHIITNGFAEVQFRKMSNAIFHSILKRLPILKWRVLKSPIQLSFSMLCNWPMLIKMKVL